MKAMPLFIQSLRLCEAAMPGGSAREAQSLMGTGKLARSEKCSQKDREMKMTNQSIILLLAIPFILFACNKAEKPPVSQGDMWECHHETTWDSLKTKNALIGEWEWEYIACFWNPEDANNNEFKGLTIEFKSNNTLNVKENGQTTQTSTWKVVGGDADLFAIDVDPSVPQLYGRILLCNERVEFNNSYIDGCDNYFKRKK